MPVKCIVKGVSHCPHRAYNLFVEKRYKQLNKLKPKLNILSVMRWSTLWDTKWHYTEILKQVFPTNLTLEPTQRIEEIYLAHGWRDRKETECRNRGKLI